LIAFWVQVVLAAWTFVLAGLLAWAGKGRLAVLAPACLGLSILAFNLYRLAPARDLKFAYELQALGLNGVAVLYVGVLTYVLCNRPRPLDPLACILWAIVAALEIYALVIERIGCAILGDRMSWEILAGTWGETVAMSACARVVSDTFVWLPLAAGVGVMTVIAGLSIRWSNTSKS
jgi:hypothetical protein